MVPDMCEARAMISLFFLLNFPQSELGVELRDSALLNQAERARQQPPDIRTHVSNKHRPITFWQEYDALHLPKEKAYTDSYKKLPPQWDLVTRPIVANLYKAGIIENGILNNPVGQIIARKESGREDLDMFIDYRDRIDDIILPPEMENPPSRESLMTTARLFALAHPKARFALLRLWSAPYFYPLMLGSENRAFNSFADCIGRAWEWKFVPKDMPYSEWSMHHASQLRLEPFKHLPGKNVVISRNRFMVMASDEAELLQLAIATTFAIQTDPWRLEVDLWRSFVNIDFTFMENMRTEWLE